MTNELKKEIEKIINKFERNHKKVFDSGDGDYFVDCSIVDNFITRTAPRKEWLGNDESWKKAKEEESERDKHIRCYVCEFIEKLKQKLKENKNNDK